MPASDDRIRVRVLFFAQARDFANASETVIELPPESTVAQAADALRELYPRLRELLARCRFAVDQEFRNDSDLLASDCEFAVLPPVSGG